MIAPPDKFSKSVSIIVPTFNEVENIRPLVSQLIAVAVPFKELLFVDAHSTDGTQDVIRSLIVDQPVRLIEQDPMALGLAAAIMAGAHFASGELLLVMDADLSHPPERVGDLLGPLLVGTADLVIGSRYVTGGSTPDWPRWRQALSRSASLLAYPLTRVHDSMCGFFAISRQRLLQIAPVVTGFKIVFEILVKGGANLRVIEVPIAFRDRVRGQSKMSFGIAARFFWQWLLALFRSLRSQPLSTAGVETFQECGGDK
jgi:dolichol-phosphate mannosyltransferase